MSSLVDVAEDAVGRDVDLGVVTLTGDLLRRYAAAVGDAALVLGREAAPPLGLALAMRGGPSPAVAATPGTVSVHGGHTIALHGCFAVGQTYRIASRIVEVFEKSGRSGPLAVITRRAVLCALDGTLAVAIDEQEIVRWRRALPVPSDAAAGHDIATAAAAVPPAPPAHLGTLGVGDVVTESWSAPAASQVNAYSDFIGAPNESLFTDAQFARGLGYRDVIVPGPVQSAAMEAMLRRRIAAAVLVRLSLTFRMSISPGDRLTMTAVVVEHRRSERGSAVVCDLAVEHGSDRTAIGTAELHPA